MKQIITSTVQEAVYEEILKNIISGRFSPGEKITMEGLASMLGVSLTPIRIAVKMLETGGYVEIGKNRRIAVRQLSDENLKEIFEIRRLLEGYAIEQACNNMTEKDFEVLEDLNQKCDAASNGDEYLKANWNFHNYLYSKAKMPNLDILINQMWNQCSPYLHILLRNEHKKVINDFNPIHVNIIESLRHKDEKAVRKWLIADLTNAADVISKKLVSAKGAGN